MATKLEISDSGHYLKGRVVRLTSDDPEAIRAIAELRKILGALIPKKEIYDMPALPGTPGDEESVLEIAIPEEKAGQASAK